MTATARPRDPRRLEKLLVDDRPSPCDRCPFWQLRNGNRVYFPSIKSVLVRGALYHPLVVLGFTAGLVLGTLGAMLLAR